MAIKVPAVAGKIIHIGRAGENLATTVTFDVSDWIREFTNAGTFTLFVQQGGGEYYPQDLKESSASQLTNNVVEWEVTNANTATVGLGKCELVYAISQVIVKSVIYDIVVTNSLDIEAAGEIPSPIESWLNEVSHMTDEIAHAADYAEDAERWAKGTVNGTDVPTTDPGYHNNAKYYSEQAASSASGVAQYVTDAENAAKESERWAKGTENGTPVSSGDGYNDNSKYYARKAERWAVGNENGTPVSSGDGYHDNAKYYAQRIQSLETGTVTTGNPGSSASANVVVDTANNRLTLNMTIPRGDQGYGLKIIGTKTSQSQLPSASSAGAGTAYGVGSSLPYDIYISTGTNTGGTYNGWVNYGPISGMVATLVDWTA